MWESLGEIGVWIAIMIAVNMGFEETKKDFKKWIKNIIREAQNEE